MSWMVIVCLLGAGGVLRETHSMDPILRINEKNIDQDNPVRRRLIEGDIITTRTSRFSPKLAMWQMKNGNVEIPYTLSAEYGEEELSIIHASFRDMEASTCIHFVNRSMERDFISIVQGDGCYSSIGRVQGKQEVSLARECLQRGKGVVLHELLHVLGFWHEHARADRDNHVIIHWKNIRADYMPNFCKQETTNMLVDYDFGSLLHYSSNAFSKNREMTIEPRKTNVFIGQRVKLSSSDIARINKLYHCSQDTPSEGDSKDLTFNEVAAPPIAGCPETSRDLLDFSDVFTNSSMASTLSLSSSEAQTTVSPPTNTSKISTVDLHSSSPEPKSFSASFPNQNSRSLPTDFWNLATLEQTHSITSLTMHKKDATFEATRRTATYKSIKVDISTVLNTHKTADQVSDDYRTGVTMEISSLGSSVTNSELNSSDSISTDSTITESSLPKTVRPTMDNVNIWEGRSTLQASTITQSREIRQLTTSENTSSPGLGVNVSPNQDNEHVKKNSLLTILRKRSLAEKKSGSRSEHLLRWILGNKSIYANNERRKSPRIIEPFCGFEHGFCGWKQSAEGDLDWKLSWGSTNDSGHFKPEGFHLSVKSNPEVGASMQKALLLKPILKQSNCITFWYGSQRHVMGTLNVYIGSSGHKETLLWSSGQPDHVKWTKAKILLPPNLLYSNVQVVVEGVLGRAETNSIAIAHLYVGQCS